MTSLEHRRDVSALVVCHKVQVQGVPHLHPLRLLAHTAQRRTRAAAGRDDQVMVPLSRTNQHQRTYTARISRLWNMFMLVTPHVQDMNTHQVKLAAHRWRGTQPSTLVL